MTQPRRRPARVAAPLGSALLLVALAIAPVAAVARSSAAASTNHAVAPVAPAATEAAGGLQPSIHYEDALAHANDVIDFVPGDRGTVGFSPRAGDGWAVDGAAGRSLPPGLVSGRAVREGKLYGRGAYDMKGSLAACLGAVKALADAKPQLAGAVLVAAVADEEHASLGTADLLRHYQPDAAIVTEPTALEICLAHKGFAWIDIETTGRAAHGSRPDLGVDANLAMGCVLAALAPFQRALRARPPHPLLGTPSLHVGVLAGGTAPSVYAAGARATSERRTVPGETDEPVLGEIEGVVARLGRDGAARRERGRRPRRGHRRRRGVERRERRVELHRALHPRRRQPRPRERRPREVRGTPWRSSPRPTGRCASRRPSARTRCSSRSARATRGTP